MPEVDNKMAELARRAAALAPQRPWLQAMRDLRVAANSSAGSNYGALGRTLHPYLNQPQHHMGGSSETFLRLVLYHLAKDILVGKVAPDVRLPPSVRELFVAQACRIAQESADETAGHFGIDHDFFLKDLALVMGHLLPVGAELVQPHAGIPRRVLFTAGARQCLGAAWYFLARHHGFKHYLALHMDSRQLSDFNPEGWRQTYLRIAQLLELNPAISGVFGSAWFYDPAIAQLSPHLAYLREVREAAGARNFRGQASPEMTRSAIATSRRRTALYQQGSYRPASWFLVWHRRELLHWAKAQRVGGGDG